MIEDLRRIAQAWLDLDPNAAHRELLVEPLANRDELRLRQLFGAPLTFGTAGLRGTVGPGTGAMNELTVRSFARALGDYVRARVGGGRLIVGFDARPESEGFARQIADELRSFGHDICFVEPASPTPLVAFLARRLGADSAVAVTASHNPRGDAGIKVFDEKGIQINHPWDDEIQQRMGLTTLAGIERLRESVPSNRQGSMSPPEAADVKAYFSWIEELGRQVDSDTAEEIRVAYSPLHGVGLSAIERVSARLGVQLVVVAEQARPDGSFPTLPRPNPEEPGALDRLRSVAVQGGVDWALANDPDADRLAIVAPAFAGDSMRQWSGDELGLLLADAWLEASRIEAPLLVTSVVSSPAIDALAVARGGRVARTLTGFKWICHRADDDQFAFAYEEALGYCFGLGRRRPVLDKDGVAAFAVIVSLARRLARGTKNSPGEALAIRLAELAVELGLWVNQSHNIQFETEEVAARAKAGQEELRSEPFETLLDWTLVKRTDFRLAEVAAAHEIPPDDLLSLEFSRSSERAVVHLRPSGTEPKLKFYCHLRGSLASLHDYARERGRLEREARLITATLSEKLLRER